MNFIGRTRRYGQHSERHNRGHEVDHRFQRVGQKTDGTRKPIGCGFQRDREDSSTDGKPCKASKVRRFHARPSYMALSRPWAGESSEVIIPGAEEVQYAEPVTEGIAHHGDAPPREGLNFSFELGAARQGALNRRFNIFDLKIHVHRRPVAAVVARCSNIGWGGTSPRAGQKVHARGRSRHLSDRPIEKTPAKSETERTLIKGYAPLKIIDVNVNLKFHVHGPIRNFTDQTLS